MSSEKTNKDSDEALPEIPKEWNLTDQQRTNMIAAQRKTMEENKQIKLKQQDKYNQFTQHSTISPPEYPIIVSVKEKNNYNKNYFLMDNNQNYIYATTFQDATAKVKKELDNSISTLQKIYTKENPGSNKLRLSSDNVNSTTKINNFSLIPSSNYKYWEIITTNAPSSMLSSFRMATQSKGKGGKRKIKKRSKKNKSKSKRKSSRVVRK